MAVSATIRGNKIRLQYMYNGVRKSKTIPLYDPKTGKKISNSKLEKEKALFMVSVQEENSPNQIKFKIYSEKWLNEYAEKKVSPKTLHSYKQYLNTHILNELGEYKLIDITPYVLTRFFNTLTEFSTNTIKRYKALLSIMLNTAVKWEMIEYNPIGKVDLPKGTKPANHISFLNSNEIKKLEEALTHEDNKYKAIVLLALKCGLRRSEIAGLSWEDIDFSAKTLHIQKAISYTKETGTFVSNTKNESSKRVIYISDEVLNCLKLLPHIDNEYNLIFGLLNLDAITRWFKRFLRRNNLKEIRFHDLRHTHATMLIANNINIKTVSSRLGHSQVSTTLNIYTHSLSEEDKKASLIL